MQTIDDSVAHLCMCAYRSWDLLSLLHSIVGTFSIPVKILEPFNICGFMPILLMTESYCHLVLHILIQPD